MRSMFYLKAAALLALLSLPMAASAQRQLSIESYGIPSEGAIALAVAQGVPAEGSFASVNQLTAGALQRAVATAGFTGERGTVLNLPGIAPYAQVILVGTGADPTSPRLLEDIGGLVGQAGVLSAAPRIELLWPNGGAEAAHLLFGASLGQYTFRQYRTPDPKAPVLGEGTLVLRTADADAAIDAWKARWQPVAEAVRFARDLSTQPANVLYPESFIERTRAAFQGVPKIRIDVLDVAAMEKLGMGALLAVGQGSARPPRLLIVHYDGGRASEAPLAFVGKGITFDTGGISLKEPADMWRMKADMSGAAVVTSTVLALAKRNAPVNAVAIAALAENMPDGRAMRPGDVLRTMSGKTIEVMSTDAEGRLILTDAIWYTQEKLKPRLLIDVATLTGSVVVALGDDYAGLFSRHDTLAAQLQAAGTASGEDVWRLPLHPSYLRDIASPIADLRNGGTRSAGAGLGAAFIGAWVDESLPWAHLDIAGMDWRDTLPLPTVPLGASAYGVRLLDRLVADHYE